MSIKDKPAIWRVQSPHFFLVQQKRSERNLSDTEHRASLDKEAIGLSFEAEEKYWGDKKPRTDGGGESVMDGGEFNLLSRDISRS